MMQTLMKFFKIAILRFRHFQLWNHGLKNMQVKFDIHGTQYHLTQIRANWTPLVSFKTQSQTKISTFNHLKTTKWYVKKSNNKKKNTHTHKMPLITIQNLHVYSEENTSYITKVIQSHIENKTYTLILFQIFSPYICSDIYKTP